MTPAEIDKMLPLSLRSAQPETMTYLDSAILNAIEGFCRTFQRLTGKTSVWLAFQLTNLSVILYFVWAALYFWNTDTMLRITVGVFCGGVFYALSQTVFKVSLEDSENNAYRRVAKGLRNPRRLRDAVLRISFLTLSIVLCYPILVVYVNLRNLRAGFALLGYFLTVLTTLLLYLLACDPLPPCAGKIREWIRGFTRLRLASAESVDQ